MDFKSMLQDAKEEYAKTNSLEKAVQAAAAKHGIDEEKDWHVYFQLSYALRNEVML